jgi:hypothetical protein
MKNIIILFLIVFSMFAFAKEEVKFYDFSDMMINGDFKKPDMLKIKDKKSAKFKRMLKLKASFINKLEKTDKDSSIE